MVINVTMPFDFVYFEKLLNKLSDSVVRGNFISMFILMKFIVHFRTIKKVGRVS